MKRIYLDTASTTPIDRRVWNKMKKEFKNNFGNPSSIHAEGVRARKVLEASRSKLASLFGIKSSAIIFTSGGTESNNLGLKGVAETYRKKHNRPGHIITTAIEHLSVLEPIRKLSEEGFSVTYLPVNELGHISLSDLKESLREDTCLVSIAYVNNEIGVVNPLRKISKIINDHRQTKKTVYPYFHTDACQATRFFDLSPHGLGVDLLTFNASKIYGPKGIGALVFLDGVELAPQALGGGQEGGLRSGTESVPLVVGLVAALEICLDSRKKEKIKLTELRNYFFDELKKKFPTVIINGDLEKRSPANINFSFPGVEAEFLVIILDSYGIAVSAGSACSSNVKAESYVLKNLTGDSKNEAIRLTLDRQTTKRNLAYVLRILPKALETATGDTAVV